MGRVQCFTAVVDDEVVTYRAVEALDESEMEAFTVLIRAAKQKLAQDEAAMTPEQRAARDERQTRLRARVDRIRSGS